MKDQTYNRPIFNITFQLKRSKKVHLIHGIWSMELKPNGTLWVYTNEPDGAYFITDVRRIIDVTAETGHTILDSMIETKKLLH